MSRRRRRPLERRAQCRSTLEESHHAPIVNHRDGCARPPGMCKVDSTPAGVGPFAVSATGGVVRLRRPQPPANGFDPCRGLSVHDGACRCMPMHAGACRCMSVSKTAPDPDTGFPRIGFPRITPARGFGAFDSRTSPFHTVPMQLIPTRRPDMAIRHCRGTCVTPGHPFDPESLPRVSPRSPCGTRIVAGASPRQG